MRWFICAWLMIGMMGCAGGGADSGVRHRAGPSSASAELPPLRPDGWLNGGHALREDLDVTSCLVLAHALEDTDGSWLWIRLELEDGAVVRVAGPGALEVHLRRGDRRWSVRDLGLHVPLRGDGNTYLNSESGPITIRAHHGLEDDQGGVSFLARLPVCDVEEIEAVAVTAVEGVWLRRP